MAVTNLPIVSALRTRLHWHQTRQKVLAENVANANTPGFQPRDLQATSPAKLPGAGLSVARTSPLHLASASAPVGPGARKLLVTRPGRPATPSASRTRC
jgi:flagellar basal-body rod protein FlgB